MSPVFYKLGVFPVAKPTKSKQWKAVPDIGHWVSQINYINVTKQHANPWAPRTLDRSFPAWCTCGLDLRRRRSFVVSPVSLRPSFSSSSAEAGYCSLLCLPSALQSALCTVARHTRAQTLIELIYETYIERDKGTISVNHLPAIENPSVYDLPWHYPELTDLSWHPEVIYLDQFKFLTDWLKLWVTRTYYRHGFLGASSYGRRSDITIIVVSWRCGSGRWWLVCILQPVGSFSVRL